MQILLGQQETNVEIDVDSKDRSLHKCREMCEIFGQDFLIFTAKHTYFHCLETNHCARDLVDLSTFLHTNIRRSIVHAKTKKRG